MIYVVYGIFDTSIEKSYKNSIFVLPKVECVVAIIYPLQSFKFVSSFREQIVARPEGNLWN